MHCKKRIYYPTFKKEQASNTSSYNTDNKLLNDIFIQFPIYS